MRVRLAYDRHAKGVTMGEGFASSVGRWYVRRATRGREGGRLVYVQRDGQVVDMGAFTRDDLLSLAWAAQVAYRLTRDRGERSRLSRMKESVGRLAREASRLE